MSQEDSSPPPRQTPRFVPTLTEIVTPPQSPNDRLSPLPVSMEPSDGGEWPPSSLNEAVAELMNRLGPELDARISETIAQVLHEQMPVLNARIRQAVANVVRETVAAAELGQDASKVGENP